MESYFYSSLVCKFELASSLEKKGIKKKEKKEKENVLKQNADCILTIVLNFLFTEYILHLNETELQIHPLIDD